jgi:hypothetical protein
MSEPFEIIAAPFDVWWAPVDESFPDLADAPAGNWTKIGTSGARDYNEEGVTINHEQTVEMFRGLGSTGPRKAFRTEEALSIAFQLHDLTLAQYALALNSNTVGTTAAGSGTAGVSTLGLYRGTEVQLIALLVRGAVSPAGAGWSMQYEVPVCFQNGSPAPVYQKDQPAGLALEFMALEDPDASTEDERFGRLVVQTADATA